MTTRLVPLQLSLLATCAFSVGCGLTSPEGRGGASVDGGTDGGRDGGPDDGGDPTDDAGVTFFTGTYLAESSGSCRRSMGFVGAERNSSVRSPLFVYVVGTLDNYGYSSALTYSPASPNRVVLSILEEAAARGIVAVSPEYENFFLTGCAGLRAKTQCLFDPSESEGLIAKLCARRTVDCSLGVVVAGHSQGSQIALYARNWNADVRAVWGLGATSDYLLNWGGGDQPGLANPNGSADDRCLRKDMTAIAAERVRLVDGENEVCFASSVPPRDSSGPFPGARCGMASSQGELERMSGTSCALDAVSCLAPNGSGWLVVPNASVLGGSAHHTWFGVPIDGGVPQLEPSFAAPSAHPWSLPTNLAWVRAFLGAGLGGPLRVDVGTTSARDGAFSKDPLGAGSATRSVSAAIDASAADAAPAAVYQTYRLAEPGAALQYELRGLSPNAAYRVRLHFAEVETVSVGARRFDVVLQGTRREVDLDVLVASGGRNRALVKSYAVQATSDGRVTIVLAPGSAGLPLLNGFEVTE